MMQNKNDEQQVFDTLAQRDIYSEAYDEEYAQLFKELFSDSSFQNGKTVLDVGCGTGNNSIRLATLGYQVTGIDLSPKSIEVAEQKALGQNRNLIFMVEDAEMTSFHPDTFDICFCGAILHHFRNIDRVALELFRITKKGGMVCSYDPNALHPYSFFTHNILNKWFHLHKFYKYFSENERALSPSDLQSAFEKAGFKDFVFTSTTLHSKKKSFQRLRNIVYYLSGRVHSNIRSGNMIVMKCKKI